jgi:uncharacterized membrane protein YphA (DoxX/SURF4 family)
MKKYNIIYWISTGIMFLFEGVMPAFTSQSEMAKQGISHLGYPPYFGVALAIFKVLGAIVLILPQAKGRIKEWAYAGFTFNILFAIISNTVVDGFGAGTIFPIIIGLILALSYWSYHKRMQVSVA